MKKRTTKKPSLPQNSNGYSGTPLPKKLGADKAESVMLLHAPVGFESRIRGGDGIPRIRRGGHGQADLVIWFVTSRSELTTRIATVKKAMADGGGMWIAWPKKASGVVTDVSEQAVRDSGLANGLVDYKVCAIDETWSGLKFARTKPKRSGP
jgi:Protein of unknown function (DUF3052)